jgi:hypothetical protein
VSKLTRVVRIAGVLFLCGCSYSGAASVPPVDVAGLWKFWTTPEGEAEVGPTVIHFAQDGSVLDSVDTTGLVEGNRLTWHPHVSDLTTSRTYLGTAVADLADGTFTVTGLSPSAGTWRAQRFVPAGTISVDGGVGGIAVAADGAAAFGARRYSDALLTTLAEVTVVLLDADRRLELRFGPVGLAVGTLDVPAVATVTVSLETDEEERLLAAVTGTLEVSKYDGTGFAATFTLDLGGGEIVTGSFDVPFDVSAYIPPA